MARAKQYLQTVAAAALSHPFKHLISEQYKSDSILSHYWLLLPAVFLSESMFSMLRQPSNRHSAPPQRSKFTRFHCVLCLPQRPTAPKPISLYYCNSVNQPQLVLVRHHIYRLLSSYDLNCLRANTPHSHVPRAFAIILNISISFNCLH